MSEESKFMIENCPLCDGSPAFRPMVVYPNGEKSPAIVKCKCGVSVASFDSDAAAVEKWNKRPQLERALETIEAQSESYSQQFKELLDARAELSQARFDLATVTENYRRLLDELKSIRAELVLFESEDIIEAIQALQEKKRLKGLDTDPSIYVED